MLTKNMNGGNGLQEERITLNGGELKPGQNTIDRNNYTEEILISNLEL